MPHLRIEQSGRVATDTKVIHVDADGVETDLSSCVSRVELEMGVGEAVTATITAFVGRATVEGVDVEHVLTNLQRVKRSRLPWRRREREVTSFGARFREWVRL